MSDQEFILAPATVTVDFTVLPVDGALNSILILNQAEELSGLGEWVMRTWQALSPEHRRFNMLIGEGLLTGFDCEDCAADFPSYIQTLASRDATTARDGVLKMYLEKYNKVGNVPPLTLDEMLADESAFMRVVETLHQAYYVKKGHYEFDPALFKDLHAILQDPIQMRDQVVAYLSYMWEQHLKDDWAHNLPTLQACVRAFKQQNYIGMTVLEATRAVTGRDMSEHWTELENVSGVTFVPSAHIGPYNSYFVRGDTMYVFFGVRMPRGVQTDSTALSRSELLVRLNALADDTRLTILDLLTKHNELCAQDIINLLDLSQSSASRHLRQLTATGYLIERRRDVAKCYSINMERVDDTLKALKSFLKR